MMNEHIPAVPPPHSYRVYILDLCMKIAAVLGAFWLGLQVMAGYIAAPVLFAALPKLQAGALAGQLFGYVSYGGLLLWGMAFLLVRGKGIALLWLLIAANQFLVTPVIEALKTQGSNWLLSLTGGTFGMWHGISSLIYLICALLAVWNIWRLLGWGRPQH